MQASRLLAVVIVVLISSVGPVSAATCPTALVFTPSAAGGDLDLGTSGVTHDTPIPGATFRLAVSCAASTPPCGVCTITGLLPSGIANRMRCHDDSSIVCTVANEVAVCGGVGQCRYFLAPPTPTGGLLNSLCYTSEATGPLSGTVDTASGALALNVPLEMRLYVTNGYVYSPNPCGRCIADASADDGARGGTCTSGLNVAGACDAAAAPGYATFTPTSIDCPPDGAQFAPDVAPLVAGTVTYSTGSQTVTLTPASPHCLGITVPPNDKCFCESCNNPARQVCMSDADCPDPAGAEGPRCGGKRCIAGLNDGMGCSANSECPGGVCAHEGASTPNACVGDTATETLCVDTMPIDGQGICTGGPASTVCSEASASPRKSCQSDNDCGGASGSCVLELPRCFPDDGVVGGSVTVSGSVAPPLTTATVPATIGAQTCVRNGLDPGGFSVDNQFGFPGMARWTAAGTLTFADEATFVPVGAGGVATTSTVAPASGVEVSATSPKAGEVGLLITAPDATPPSGFQVIGRRVRVSGPPSTPTAPWQIAFEIDAAEIPVTNTLADIAVIATGGTAIADCVGPGIANPDPCVVERTPLAGGDARVGVLASAGGDFTFGIAGAACPAAPATCRQPFLGARSLVRLLDKTPDARDLLDWRWLVGTATAKSEFGNPLVTDAFALCLYDATGLRATLVAPPGPRWVDKAFGPYFKDKSLTPSGLSRIVLRAGADGKAQIQVKARGENVPLPSPGSIVAPITVQLRNVTTGTCWGAHYSAPFTTFSAIHLKARSD